LRAFPTLDSCADLVRQHVKEDLGYEATFRDWVDGLDFKNVPQPVIRRVGDGPRSVAGLVANRAVPQLSDEPTFQMYLDAATEVAEFLWQPLHYSDDPSYSVLSVLMNSAGPPLVRKVFGPPVLSSQGSAIDYGYLAEAIIMASFGRIPDLLEIVRSIKREPIQTGHTKK
jgi:hypothetical protein